MARNDGSGRGIGGRRAVGAAAIVAAAVAVAACGSGGSSSGGTGGTPGTMTGRVVKGPVAGAQVAAYAVAGGAMGTPIGSATTDASGAFTMTLRSSTGPVVLQVTGGSYTDEATGASMAMSAGVTMSAAIPSMAEGGTAAGIQVTPLTTMAQAMAAGKPGGMTAANVTAANAAVGSYFSAGDILHTAPMDPLVTGSGATATQEQKDYGMTLAAMSEYAHELGMPDSSGMVTAMTEDASDGTMNGMMGSTAVSMGGMGGMMGGTTMSSTAGTSGLANAMTAFIGSNMNRSGVTASEMQALVTKLAGSSGAIQ